MHLGQISDSAPDGSFPPSYSSVPRNIWLHSVGLASPSCRHDDPNQYHLALSTLRMQPQRSVDDERKVICINVRQTRHSQSQISRLRMVAFSADVRRRGGQLAASSALERALRAVVLACRRPLCIVGSHSLCRRNSPLGPHAGAFVPRLHKVSFLRRTHNVRRYGPVTTAELLKSRLP